LNANSQHEIRSSRLETLALVYVALAGALFVLWRFTPLRNVLRIGRRESAVALLWKRLRR
jgi:hypothetical protein